MKKGSFATLSLLVMVAFAAGLSVAGADSGATLTKSRYAASPYSVASADFVLKEYSSNITFNQRLINTTRDSFYALLPSEIGLSDFQDLARAQLIAAANNTSAEDPARYFHNLIAQRPLVVADGFANAFLNAGAAQVQQLPFVRDVSFDYRSPLGNRPWQAGVSAIGSLHETTGNALAWQLRGYGADDDATGANVGLLARWVNANDSALFGANVFYDYESNEYGDFHRWAGGVEVRTAWWDLAVNRYEPITSAQRLDDGTTAYSKRGMDAALNLHAPSINWLSGGATYYNFEGEFGDEDDNGWRYHIAVAPWGFGSSGLQAWFEYDVSDGDGSEFGGGVSYQHYFNEAAQGLADSSSSSFSARSYFYEPARREYAQRIGVAETLADGYYVMLPTDTNARAGIQINTEAILTNTVYAITISRLDMTTEANGFELTRPAGWYATIGASAQLAYENSTLSITAGVLGYRRLGGNQLSAIVADLGSSSVTVGLGGEVLISINNNRASVHAIAGDFNLGDAADDDVSLQVAHNATVYWGSRRYDGGSNLAVSPTLIALLSSQGTSGSSAGQLVASGGGSGLSYTFEAVGNHPAINVASNGALSFTANTSDDTNITIRARTNNGGFSTTATINIRFIDSLSLQNPPASNPTIIENVASPVITLSVSGGLAPYTYAFIGTPPSGFQLSHNGSNEVTLAVAARDFPADTFTLSLTIHSAAMLSDITPEVTLDITPAINFAGAIPAFTVVVNDTSNFANLAPYVQDGSGAYTYNIISDTSNALVVDTNGMLRFSPAITQDGTITAEVEISDISGALTATLTINAILAVSLTSDNNTYYFEINSNAAIATLAAQGGTGNYTYSILGSNPNNVQVDSDGELTFPTPPTSIADFMLTAHVADGIGLTATLQIRIVVIDLLQFTDDSIDLILQGNQHESTAVLTLATQGGVSGTHNIVLQSANPSNWNTLFNFGTASGSNRLTLTDNGAVDAGGNATLVFAVTDDSGQTANATLTLAIPRRMHIIGGIGNHSIRLNDVWASTNGKQWYQKTANAGFAPRTGHEAVALNSTMYVIGGGQDSGNNQVYYNDVWSSTDGITWTQETAAAGFDARRAHQAVVLNNTIYVMGGTGASDAVYRDVWSSTDGSSWTLVTATAAFGARFDYSAVAFNNKVYVVGGYSGQPVPYSDVWSSSDGAIWTLETETAAFIDGGYGRAQHAMAVFNNSMFLVGGVSRGNQSDVWSSTDGASWTQETAHIGLIFRTGHRILTFGNKLYLITGELSQGLWFSTNGATWTQETANSFFDFPARSSHAALLFP